MSSLHEGGPAFPCDVFDPDIKGPEQWEGMSLRAYFAGQALQGLLANPKRYAYIAGMVESGAISQEEASAKNARKALLLADALIAELAK